MSFAGLSVERETTVDRVVTELRRALFDGELEPGTPLREVALADTLGVSRSTVREALAGLVAEGLAVRVPNKGTAVRELSAEAITDVCHARTVLESAGVRCWHTATEGSREAVRDALSSYDEVARGEPTNAELNWAHVAFHRSLVALTGSERLVATEEALSTEIRLALAKVDRSRRNAREQVRSHAVLVDLLESGDLDAAEAELERHIIDGRDSMIEELGLDA
jgi:DNA-binding GntR family transcriptional regulator